MMADRLVSFSILYDGKLHSFKLKKPLNFSKVVAVMPNLEEMTIELRDQGGCIVGKTKLIEALITPPTKNKPGARRE